MEILKETTVDELETYIKTYVPTYKSVSIAKELLKYKALEEQMGCPLEVRCNIIDGNFVYNEKGIGLRVEMIFENYFIGWHALTDTSLRYYYKDYKKTWWLKPDRSE